MNAYNPVSKEFTFERATHKYHVFFGRSPPPLHGLGTIGDLFFSSPDPEGSRELIAANQPKPRSETEHIYLKLSNGWSEMMYGRIGMNNTPIMIHPIYGATHRLNESFCMWRSKGYYSASRGKKAIAKVLPMKPVEVQREESVVERREESAVEPEDDKSRCVSAYNEII
jgi:hypothetical protein